MTDNRLLPPVFHEGEVSLHKSLGIDDRLADLGRHMIRDHMPDQHREFFTQLPWVHLAAVDGEGHPWATVRTGKPGFMQTPDNKTLCILSTPPPGEPADLQLSPGSKVSIVGLDTASRRRNRLNGTVKRNADNQLHVAVDQSYGNCPKYIQKRTPHQTTEATPSVVSVHSSLDQTDSELLKRADTLYIASRAAALSEDPRFGVDINHRGGLPGFVSILNNTTILIPDYKGNNFFNTLGNITHEPRVGIQVIDYVTATLLNLQGQAEILTIEDNELTPPDMGRRLKISITAVTRSTGSFPYQSQETEYSPYLSP